MLSVIYYAQNYAGIIISWEGIGAFYKCFGKDNFTV